METKVLAICDTEVKYAVKLMETFCEKQKFGFQIHTFSKLDELERYMMCNSVELLLVSGKIMSEEVSRYPIPKIILLSDGSLEEKFSDYDVIYKYQSAETILREVLGYYAEISGPTIGMFGRKKEFEIHGVFSPVGRCGKTALSECLASKLGKSGRTLLLDLQSYSAHKEQQGGTELWDLSDIIYFLRQGKQTFLYKLGSIVRKADHYDYILPMQSIADLRSVTAPEWSGLLEKLAEDSDYQKVVIDFGTDICGLFQLLSQCTRVYMPVFNDYASKRKVENFFWILEDESFEEIIHNIQEIYLPEQWDYSNAGTFMKAWVERYVKV